MLKRLLDQLPEPALQLDLDSVPDLPLQVFDELKLTRPSLLAFPILRRRLRLHTGAPFGFEPLERWHPISTTFRTLPLLAPHWDQTPNRLSISARALGGRAKRNAQNSRRLV